MRCQDRVHFNSIAQLDTIPVRLGTVIIFLTRLFYSYRVYLDSGGNEPMAERVLTLWVNSYSIRQIAERLDLKLEDVQFYLGLFR